MDPDEDWKFPLLLSCFAGASTCLGAAVVFVWDARQIERSMSFSLSLAASVMITVSVISIGPECMEGIIEYTKDNDVVIDAYLLMQRLLNFGLGCASYWLLSKLLAMFPEPDVLISTDKQQQQQQKSNEDQQDLLEHNHFASHTTTTTSTSKPSSPTVLRRGNTNVSMSTSNSAEDLGGAKTTDTIVVRSNNDDDDDRIKKNLIEKRRSSWRVAMLLFASLLCHNFPEGLAVVASTVESPELGITVAIGILIHNIPEGIAIAVPCMAARPDAPWLAFWLASGSGLAEPLGAVVALFFLRRGSLWVSLENILAYVAGIMCTVAVLELYPEARKHVSPDTYPSMTTGTVAGMAIMIATEWYLP